MAAATNGPGASDAKLITTLVEAPPVNVYAAPASTANGEATPTVPANDRLPVLLTEKLRLLVWPTGIAP